MKESSPKKRKFFLIALGWNWRIGVRATSSHQRGGGYNKVIRMGDSGVNRSIGKQWETKGIADNIESQVQQQIKDMGIKIPPNSNIPNNLMMNVKL